MVYSINEQRSGYPILDNMTLHSAESAFGPHSLMDAYAAECFANVCDSYINWPVMHLFEVNAVAERVFRQPDLRGELVSQKLAEASSVNLADIDGLEESDLAGLTDELIARLNSADRRERLADWLRFLFGRMQDEDARRDRWLVEPELPWIESYWEDVARDRLREEVGAVDGKRWRDDDLHLMLVYLARGALRQARLKEADVRYAYHDHPFRTLSPTVRADSLKWSAPDYSWGLAAFRLVRAQMLARSELIPLLVRLKKELIKREAVWYLWDDSDPIRLGNLRREAARCAGFPLELDPNLTRLVSDRIKTLWPFLLSPTLLAYPAEVSRCGIDSDAAVVIATSAIGVLCYAAGREVEKLGGIAKRGFVCSSAFRREFTLPDGTWPVSSGIEGDD